MNLYLIRHAHALSEEENPSRPLSPRGRRQARALALQLSSSSSFTAKEFWHSGLVRATETAQIFAAGLGLPKTSLRHVQGLLPEDDPVAVADLIQRRGEDDLAIVGHEPILGRLASLLLQGREEPVVLDISKGAVLLLQPGSGRHRRSGLSRWQLRWMLSRELLAGDPRKSSPTP